MEKRWALQLCDNSGESLDATTGSGPKEGGYFVTLHKPLQNALSRRPETMLWYPEGTKLEQEMGSWRKEGCD